MVPAIYSTFFTTMAAVGATLFGLIFVAISIAPENVAISTGSLDRQIRATAAYIALLNPLMISLFALVPYIMVGIPGNVLSWIGILNTLAMSVALVQNIKQIEDLTRSITLIVVSFIIYGSEAYVSVRLLHPAVENFWFSIFAGLLIFITLYGIIRAWEVIGIRQFHIRDWIRELISVFIKSVRGRAVEDISGKDERK